MAAKYSVMKYIDLHSYMLKRSSSYFRYDLYFLMTINWNGNLG